jgi:RimJ/RimL family protein N-acetyltransferase
MRVVLQQWMAEDARLTGQRALGHRPPRGGRLPGGTMLLPPDGEYEMGWQPRPQIWSNGYPAETGLAVARWAYRRGIEQVIALVRPANHHAVATVRRIDMACVGETEKYHRLRMQQFRLALVPWQARSECLAAWPVSLRRLVAV